VTDRDASFVKRQRNYDPLATVADTAIVAALATDGLVLPSTINGLEQVWVSAYEEPLARRIPARAGFGSSTSGPDALAAKKLSEPDQRRPCRVSAGTGRDLMIPRT